MGILPIFKHALMISFFVFVMMYAQGLVPFSVLFTTSFVQDGHDMLPLLSYSLKDSLFIKALNLVFGLKDGVILVGVKAPQISLNQVTLTFFVKDSGVGIAPENIA